LKRDPVDTDANSPASGSLLAIGSSATRVTIAPTVRQAITISLVTDVYDVVTARHPRGVSLHHRLHRSQVQRPPPPPTRPWS